MAHVLIGWEFGTNRGHALKLASAAAALMREGHRVSFALQRLDALTDEERDGADVWQAPISPRLLVTVERKARPIPTNMADILARLGLDEPRLVAAVIRAWLRLFDAIRPDLVVADFAPFMLLAARGRLPSVLIGNAFLTPPAEMDSFPSLIDYPSAVNQDEIAVLLNEGLAVAGAQSVSALPEAFACDRRIPATFAEFDPYAEHRREALASPLPADFDARAGGGDEVFVYAPETLTAKSPLWQGLAAAGLPVRVHVPRADEAKRQALADLGLMVEPEPLPFQLIAERSRLLVSHGGPAFLSSGLAAGLPHVVFHYDLEKLWIGLAVARHGFGGHIPLATLQPQAFATSLRQLHGDEALSTRVRAAGEQLRARTQPSLDRAVVEAIAALS